MAIKGLMNATSALQVGEMARRCLRSVSIAIVYESVGSTPIVGPNLQTLTGFLELKIQRYKAQGGELVAIGATQVVIPGFGAARMMVSQ